MNHIYEYEALNEAQGLTVGDHVAKTVGQTKLRGRLCAIYRVPHEEKLWCVVLIDKSEASDHLQHLYPLNMFTKYE